MIQKLDYVIKHNENNCYENTKIEGIATYFLSFRTHDLKAQELQLSSPFWRQIL